MSLLIALAASALAQEAAPPDAGADPGKVSISVSDDFEIRYYVVPQRLPDPDDRPVFNYVEQVNRLNASVGTGDWTFEAQVDEVALFANQYILDGEPYAERQLLADPMFAPFATRDPGELNRYGYATLEKLRARVEKPGYSLAFGDTYAAFGRGIALNVNRNVDIDIDTSIQGVKAMLRPGAWDVTLVAGQLNRQQVYQDNPNLDLLGDSRHAVAGARVERFGLGPANVGAHVVAYDFVNSIGWWDTPIQLADEDPRDGTSRGIEELGTPVDAAVVGTTLELTSVGGIDWYGEGDAFFYNAATNTLPNHLFDGRYSQLHQTGTALRPENTGYATYLSAAFYPGKTTWLIEAKRYYQVERINLISTLGQYEVSVAPTVEYERAVNEDSSSAVNSNDIAGGRVRVDYTAKPGELVPYVSMAVFRDADLSHNHQMPETILHPVVGVEYIRHQGAALVNAGYRADIRDKDPTVNNCRPDNAYLCDPGTDTQLWADASVKFPFVAGLHAEVQGDFEYWTWGENLFEQPDYVEVTSGVTVQKGSDVAVTVFNDYTTNPAVTSTGNYPLEVGRGQDRTQPMYGAVEVQVKPTSALTMKGFYGAYKAGIRCSGGQCRQLPGFEGVRFSVQGSF